MRTEITDKIGRRSWAINLLVALVPFLAVMAFARDLPPWGFMWAMAVAVWIAFKWMMWTDVSGIGVPRWSRVVGFFLGWAGTDAVPFRKALPIENSLKSEWLHAAGMMLLGAGFIWLGVRAVIEWNVLAAGWVGMIGTVLMLHFGLFDLIALAWRRAGVGVEPIMCRPARARSVADFWNRWNRGFRDLAYRKVFRPLHRRIGLAGAAFGAFLFSGLIHDLMISVPAGAGYGLPTLYFLIQFLAVMFERLPAVRALTPAEINRVGSYLFPFPAVRALSPVGHWLLTCLAVIGPLPLLFHADFVRNVFLPFLAAIGAT